MAAKETQITTVTMLDGRVVDFPGKRRMLKQTIIGDDGSVKIRIDFVNGETRLFTLNPALILKFAAHGAEQKFGDETAGLTEVDDAVMAVDDLNDRLTAGEWNVKRESNGMAGTSVLAKALVEHTGKTIEEVKAFLATKTQADKAALRTNSKLKPIIERIEAAKAKKSESVDTEAMLNELEVA